MNDTNLTKQEYLYLENIKKLELLVEKQELKLKEKSENEAALQIKIDSLLKEKNEAVAVLNITIDALQNEVKEKCKVQEDQEHFIATLEKKIAKKSETEQKLETQLKESAKEILEKENTLNEKNHKIRSLRSTALNEAELSFFYACKADLILYDFFKQNKSIITLEELKCRNFPAILLEQTINKKPLETTNFHLAYINKSFQLIKNKTKS